MTLETKLKELEQIPNGKARWKASKSIKWVLSCPQLALYAGMRGLEIVSVTSKTEAVVFTGQDNEEHKAKFYKAITGVNWQPELL